MGTTLFSAETQTYVVLIIRLSIILFVGFTVINYIVKKANNAMNLFKLNTALSLMIGHIISAVLKILLIVVSLSELGVDISSVMTMLAAVAVTLGVALRDSLSNVASGIIIMVNKPFTIGDYVELNKVEGTVTDIQLFFTLLTTVDNKKVTVPNANITSNELINYTRGKVRRMEILIPMSYTVNIKEIQTLLLSVLEKEPHIHDYPLPFVSIKSYDEFNMKIGAYAWVDSARYMPTLYKMRQAIMEALVEANIEVAVVGLIKP